MRQYLEAKQQYRDAILFFRMGDFYEMFYEDALAAARALDLTLTSRSKDAQGTSIPMCGVPHPRRRHLSRAAGEKRLSCRDLRSGRRPHKAKGLVKREIVRVVSPGTLTDAQHLEEREPAFLLALVTVSARQTHPSLTSSAWRSWISRPASFRAAEYAGADGRQALSDEVSVLRPREIVAPVDCDIEP